jgi:hypothetical protein
MVLLRRIRVQTATEIIAGFLTPSGVGAIAGPIGARLGMGKTTLLLKGAQRSGGV